MKLIHYKILSTNNAVELEHEVEQLAMDGWLPLGGISVSEDEAYVSYNQAMVIYECSSPNCKESAK